MSNEIYYISNIYISNVCINYNRLFFMHCLICCIKNRLHCIKIFIYKDTLHNYSGKDVKKDFEGQWGVKTHYITKT